jgi:hypothetical protein
VPALARLRAFVFVFGVDMRCAPDPDPRRSRSAHLTTPIGDDMNSIKTAAIVLIVAGILALAYGGFSYNKETVGAKLGPIELKVTEKKTINVPMWAGIGAIVAGGVLLLGGRRS